MGCYCIFEINGSELLSNKSYIPSNWCILFHQSELRISEEIAYWDDEHETYTRAALESTTTRLIERLNILGFSYDRAVEKINSYIDNCTKEGGDESVSVDEVGRWINAVVEYLNQNDKTKVDKFDIDSYQEFLNCLSSLFGLPCSDDREILLMILSRFPENTPAALDYSELYDRTIPPDDDVVSLAKVQALNGSITRENIVIIAEGASDLVYLEKTLDILYPEMSNYFSFFDIKSPRVPGGVEEIVRLVKGIIGAKINSRFCVIFDNDYVGLSGLNRLKGIKIPKNITLMHYPDMLAFESYPVVIDRRLRNMNINRVGCSIELYFGQDVLWEHGSLSPLQLTDNGHGRQARIMNKPRIQKKFKEKCKQALNQGIHPEQDWSGMRAIWDSIFKAVCDNYPEAMYPCKDFFC